MRELEKMINGLIYDPTDDEIHEIQVKSHRLCHDYNLTYDTDIKTRNKILKELTPESKDGLYIQGDIYFDYGIFTKFGKNCYVNNHFTCLDTSPVTIGDNVLFGPNCSIYTPLHPLRYQDRNMYFNEVTKRYTDKEYSKPVTIGSNCWFGGSVTILPGVTIGEGSVIGAGSVVSKSIPKNSLAYGNPCKVIREITEEDRLELKKELLTF